MNMRIQESPCAMTAHHFRHDLSTRRAARPRSRSGCGLITICWRGSRRQAGLNPACTGQCCVEVSPGGCLRSPRGWTSGSRSSIVPGVAVAGAVTSFRHGSCLLKVSGANELGEPKGDQRPPAPGHAGPRPAMSSDRNNSSYKRGVTGSIPAAPTRRSSSHHVSAGSMFT